MKEFSIEEKAKRYDEAIEKGKQIQNTPYTAHWGTMKEVVEYLFPELEESEDEEIRKWIIHDIQQALDDSIYNGKSIDEAKKAIAWLKKQGEQTLANSAQTCKDEQTPAWSKEDSPYYDDICEILINLLHSKTSDVNKDAIQKDLDWLKSLKERYTWKPSDEQMDALSKILKYFGMMNAYGETIDRLKELGEQLKKLREE